MLYSLTSICMLKSKPLRSSEGGSPQRWDHLRAKQLKLNWVSHRKRLGHRLQQRSNRGRHSSQKTVVSGGACPAQAMISELQPPCFSSLLWGPVWLTHRRTLPCSRTFSLAHCSHHFLAVEPSTKHSLLRSHGSLSGKPVNPHAGRAVAELGWPNRDKVKQGPSGTLC